MASTIPGSNVHTQVSGTTLIEEQLRSIVAKGWLHRKEMSPMKRALISATGTLLLCVVGLQALAEPQGKGSAVLTGVVIGPDDKPVPHASITYQSSAGIAPHAVRADSRGHFSITKLKADNYDLRASSRGVFSEWEKNVTVRSGSTKSVTLHLIYAKQIPKAYTKSKPKAQ